MNITDLIIAYLQKYQQAPISGFGSFSLARTQAVIDQSHHRILPPSNEVKFDMDFSTEGIPFEQYIAQEENSSLEQIRFLIETQVDFWKKKIQNKESFEIPGLGQMNFKDGQYSFKGDRLQMQSPDFYGLEEISFQKTADDAKEKAPKKSYAQKIANIILWIFLIIIPIAGLIYLAVHFQDLLEGKVDLKDYTVTTSTHRIDDNATQPIVQDTIQQQTINNQHGEK